MAILKKVAALGRSGLHDWFYLRITALVLAGYTIYWLVLCVAHPGPFSYLEWKSLFQSPGMRLFTLLSVISLALHARAGLWAVFVDYVKSVPMRIVLNLAVLLQLILVVLWTIQILWRF